MALKIAFLLNDIGLSGGVGVVIKHAAALHRTHGHDVTIAITGSRHKNTWDYKELEGLEIAPLEELGEREFDVAIATWWETARSLGALAANHRAYFVQSIEDRFYPPDAVERIMAAQTYNLPVTYITEAGWIRDVLTAQNPGNPCYYVRNGIDKQVFAPAAAVERHDEKPLRILVEGHPDVPIKGIGEACAALERVTTSHEMTFIVPGNNIVSKLPHKARVVGPLDADEMAREYRGHDLLLKLSRVEGMFGPPLEAFHCGGTCVVTPVTGHDEYVRHGHNGVVVDWDDPAGTARWLDLLGANRDLLHELRSNALATAREWPGWDESTRVFEIALNQIVESPEPVALSAIRSNTRDAYPALEMMRHRHEFNVAEARFGRRLAIARQHARNKLRDNLPESVKKPIKRALGR